MVQKSQTTTFWMYSSPVVNNGINYQPLCIFIPKFLCCFLIWASFWFRPWVWVTEAENQQTCKRVGSFRGRFLCFRQKPSRNQLYWKKRKWVLPKTFGFPHPQINGAECRISLQKSSVSPAGTASRGPTTSAPLNRCATMQIVVLHIPRNCGSLSNSYFLHVRHCLHNLIHSNSRCLPSWRIRCNPHIIIRDYFLVLSQANTEVIAIWHLQCKYHPAQRWNARNMVHMLARCHFNDRHRRLGKPDMRNVREPTYPARAGSEPKLWLNRGSRFAEVRQGKAMRHCR